MLMAKGDRGEGTLERRNGKLWVKVPASATLSGKRERIDITPYIDGLSEAAIYNLKARIVAEMRAKTEAANRSVLEAQSTVAGLATMWTSGELARRYPAVLKHKASAREDGIRLAWVMPFLGHKAVAAITDDDISIALGQAHRAARERRGRPWSENTQRQLAQALSRLFRLAEYPCKLRPEGTNPVRPEMIPSGGCKKLKQMLYPHEMEALMACAEVPVIRRVWYAVAVNTLLRAGSIALLDWTDFDRRNETLAVRVTKTDVPLLIAVRDSDGYAPGVARVLRLWHVLSGARASGPIFPPDALPVKTGQAKALRLDLRRAGCDRAALHASNASSLRIRFHDLRATGVTWAFRAGKGLGWITDRTGHVTPAMVEQYRRGARQLADLDYEPFPRVVIPELEGVSNVRAIGG